MKFCFRAALAALLWLTLTACGGAPAASAETPAGGGMMVVNPMQAKTSLEEVNAAIGCGIAALVSPAKRFGKVASAIIFAAAGGWLRAHPLMLAATIGRFCGLFLWISSIQNIRLNKKLGRRGILPWVTAVVGFGLIFIIPLSISRMVFSLCGLVVLIAGIVILLDNLKSQNRLDEPQDPNIIDAL